MQAFTERLARGKWVVVCEGQKLGLGLHLGGGVVSEEASSSMNTQKESKIEVEREGGVRDVGYAV